MGMAKKEKANYSEIRKDTHVFCCVGGPVPDLFLVFPAVALRHCLPGLQMYTAAHLPEHEL